ncbi:hypothetical protein CL634_03175 [bacterium]|nr:hypothetical protein [bacterium]
MTFEGAKDFAGFLKGKNRLLMILPWGSDLITYVESIDKGCKCKKKTRIAHTNSVYKDLVVNTIKKNRDVQHFLKKETGEESIVFKLDEHVIAKI